MWWRIGAAVLLALIGVLVVLVLRVGVGEVRDWVAAAGLLGPVLFVALHAVVTATPVPRTVFTVAAGVLFGSVGGILLAIAGTVLASILAFWLARTLGEPLVARYSGRAPVRWARRRMQHGGLLTMVSLRLIPPVPFSVANYAAALSGARLAPYVIAVVVGILPGTITMVVLGDAAVGGRPHPVMFAVSIISACVGLLGGWLVTRRGWGTRPEPEGPDPTAPDATA